MSLISECVQYKIVFLLSSLKINFLHLGQHFLTECFSTKNAMSGKYKFSISSLVFQYFFEVERLEGFGGVMAFHFNFFFNVILQLFGFLFISAVAASFFLRLCVIILLPLFFQVFDPSREKFAKERKLLYGNSHSVLHFIEDKIRCCRVLHEPVIPDVGCSSS